MYKLIENAKVKMIRSEDYNYNFDKKTGYFARWGKTLDDDPQFSSIGPEILDIEITTQCKGPGGKLCGFCYKGNTPHGKNMSFETFKTILRKMPRTLTQCAFGADAQAESNPDLWKMMDYCRNNDYNQIIPNITVADISSETADKLIKYCGAVAVSRYADKDFCYDSVKKLTDRGLKQTNIHIMISNETYDQAVETIHDYKSDSRLAKLNAIVFLSLKQKGRGTGYTPLTTEQFKRLVDLAFNIKTPIGFDSCSANKFLKAVKDRDNYKELEMLAEPCESSCFSSYINVDGLFFPCSFTEDEWGWENGIDVVACDNFMKDIWYNKKVVEFREVLLKCKRNCPLFNV
jgi:hypothetical protein